MRTTLILLSLAGSASAAPYVGTTTGQLLVRDFLATSDRKTISADDILAHEKARGYIDGIKDATQGRLWCYSGGLKPAELNFDLIDALRAQTPAALKGNPAPLLIKALSEKYPCRGKGDAQ